MDNINKNDDWALASKEHVHDVIFDLIKSNDHPSLMASRPQPIAGLAQYLGRNPSIFNRNQGIITNNVDSFGGNGNGARLNFNLTAAAIDTLTSKLAASDIVPQAVTNKATSEGRLLADDLNFVIKGLYHKYELSNMVNLAYRDAMINRAGFIKVGIVDKDLVVERIFGDEVIIDILDGYYNNPYKITHKKNVPVNVLLLQYPEHREKILSAEVVQTRIGDFHVTTPTIVIAESWCKNTYVEKGRHVVCIQTQTLVDEHWDKDYLPILKVDYSTPVVGWVGQSVVDELEPIQKELDRLFLTVQIILKNMSVPRIFYDVNSMMNKEHFTNKPGLMLGLDLKNGVAPIIHNGASMAPELPQQIEFLIAQGYARVGLTSQDTQGMKPAGIESGEALNALSDMQSERWKFLVKNFELAHTKLCNIILKEVSQVNVKLSVLDDKIGLRQVSTKKIPRDGDSYVIQIFPTSSLPSNISGRLDTVDRMLKMGIIKPEDAPDLFDMPDLGAMYSVNTAPRKYIELTIEKMIRTKEYIYPEVFDDVNYGLVKALQYYAWEKVNGQDDEILDLMRQFISDCNEIISSKQAIAAPAPIAAPNQPQEIPQPVK